MADEDGASQNELLIYASRNDNLDILDEVLSSGAFDINFTDGVGDSALHNAARYGSIECLEILLHYDGINVDIANRLEGDTPLHKAVAYEDPDVALIMVELLVNRGASLTVKNKHRQTPADKAPSDTHGEIKTFLENIALRSQFDSRDIAADDDDDSDGVPSDDE
ncbi:hypothetical protein BGX27_007574 [Mortierella sp. AM989]|nr:hypothetical protein BGX27_007574 [Mortierella sp. AM989]